MAKTSEVGGVAGLTLVTYYWIGHWALLVAIGPAFLGLIIHFKWCKANNIHPLKATPRKRYYELRGWQWPEE